MRRSPACSSAARGWDGEALARLVRAVADAGRQEAFACTYSAGHALKNLVGSPARRPARSRGGAARRARPGSRRIAGEGLLGLGGVPEDGALGGPAARACDLELVRRRGGALLRRGRRPAVRSGRGAQGAGRPGGAARGGAQPRPERPRGQPPGAGGDLHLRRSGGRLVRCRSPTTAPASPPRTSSAISSPGFTTKPARLRLRPVDRRADRPRRRRADRGRERARQGPRFTWCCPRRPTPRPRPAPRAGGVRGARRRERGAPQIEFT